MLRKSQGISTGNLGHEDLEIQDVLDAQGQTVGTVTYTATTSIKPPFRTRHSLVQKDLAGNVTVELRHPPNVMSRALSLMKPPDL